MSSSPTNENLSYFQNMEPKTKQIICTQLGGFASTFLFYPIDTVRCRTMSHDNTNARLHHNNSVRYRGILSPLRLVVQHEGVPALYRGVSVAVGGATASWGIYMFLYKEFQEILRDNTGWEPNFVSDCVTSTTASLATAALTTPIWHVKTRMQLEDTTCIKTGEKTRKYRGFLKSLFAVYRTDGFFGLWRGFSPQLLMSAVNGVYFPVYQKVLEGVHLTKKFGVKNSEQQQHQHVSSIVGFTATSGSDKKHQHQSSSSSKPSSVEVAVASAFAKTFINLFSNPLFVIRTRLQDERHSSHKEIKYRNLLQSVKLIWQQEGLFGFYKGMRASIVITAPKSIMTMVVAEHLFHRFSTTKK